MLTNQLGKQQGRGGSEDERQEQSLIRSPKTRAVAVCFSVRSCMGASFLPSWSNRFPQASLFELPTLDDRVRQLEEVVKAVLASQPPRVYKEQ